MPDLPNLQLVDAAQHGDQGALSDLLRLQQDRIYNVVLRMIGNRDDAAEVTQDALVKIIEHIGDFRKQADISTWMIRIAMNLSFSHLRKQRVRRTTSLDDTPRPNGHGSDNQATPLREKIADERELEPGLRVEQDEMLSHLHIAISRLQDDLRAVLVLRDIDDMDYQQIAQVMAIPMGTVKSRLFRARLALRHEMFTLCPPHKETGDKPGPAATDAQPVSPKRPEDPRDPHHGLNVTTNNYSWVISKAILTRKRKQNSRPRWKKTHGCATLWRSWSPTAVVYAICPEKNRPLM